MTNENKNSPAGADGQKNYTAAEKEAIEKIRVTMNVPLLKKLHEEIKQKSFVIITSTSEYVELTGRPTQCDKGGVQEILRAIFDTFSGVGPKAFAESYYSKQMVKKNALAWGKHLLSVLSDSDRNDLFHMIHELDLTEYLWEKIEHKKSLFPKPQTADFFAGWLKNNTDYGKNDLERARLGIENPFGPPAVYPKELSKELCQELVKTLFIPEFKKIHDHLKTNPTYFVDQDHPLKHALKFTGELDIATLKGHMLQWIQALSSHEALLRLNKLAPAIDNTENKQIMKIWGENFFKILTPEDRHTFFQMIHELDLTEDLWDSIDAEKSLLKTPDTGNLFGTWLEKNTDYYKEEQELEATLAPVAKTASAEIQVIEVENPLIHRDVVDDLLPAAHSNASENAEEAHPPQKRLDPLAEALLRDQMLAKSITIYKQKSIEGAQTDHYPYSIIDIHADHLKAQIAVCDFYGFNTYIIHNPKEIDPQNILKISDLKDDPLVWTAKYDSEEQWLTKIRSLLYSDVKTLETELKHRIAWKDKKQPLEQSFISYVTATGKLPRSTDTAIISHGALHTSLNAKTTWNRAYMAITGKTIFGLEETTSFHKLYDALKEKHPELEKFLYQPPISARNIFNDSAKCIKNTGYVPQKLFNDDFVIAGHTPKELSFAFQHHAIADWVDFVPDAAPEPASFEEFMVSSGLAVYTEYGLEPAPVATPA